MGKCVIGLVLGASLGAAQIAVAQDSAGPVAVPRLIRLVVPFSAGASNDAIARAIAPPLAKRLEAHFEVPVLQVEAVNEAGQVAADELKHEEDE